MDTAFQDYNQCRPHKEFKESFCLGTSVRNLLALRKISVDNIDKERPF